MHKAYKFRFYLNDNQKELIHKTFGCVRFIYNYFLYECKVCGNHNDRDLNASINIIFEVLKMYYQN